MNNYLKKRVEIGVLLVLLLVGAYFLLPKLLVCFGPFLVGYVFSWIATPIHWFLTEKVHFPKKLAAIITVLLVIGVIGGIFAMFIIKIASESAGLAEKLPAYYESLSSYARSLLESMESTTINMPSGIVSAVGNLSSQISTMLSNMLSSWVEPVTRGALNVASHLPQVLIFLVVTFVSAYFFISDKAHIKAVLKEKLPRSFSDRVSEVKRDLIHALAAYFRAQLMLMGVTFLELLIGLSVLRINYALVIGLLVAVLDAIPVFGVGTVLLPWAVVSFVMQKPRIGIGLLILYGICLVVRQILEPKFVSQRIGLHPLVTLMSMYVGLKIFGFFGIIFGPVLVLIVRNLYQAGVFNVFFPSLSTPEAKPNPSESPSKVRKQSESEDNRKPKQTS